MPAFAGMTLVLLAGCISRPDTVFTLVPVDMPVPMCVASNVAMPPDIMGALPKSATLTQFTRSCAAQVMLDKAALIQFQAALKSCSEN